MVRESLILTFQLMQKVVSSLHREAGVHIFQEVYHDLMKRTATQCQHVFDEMMKYYKTCCLKYFLQSIKEYIQQSNIKFHKSRPDFCKC